MVAPRPAGVEVAGAVVDTAFRPLAGARVEAVDGVHAGRSTTADGQGRFSLVGEFDSATAFRASLEGHLATTRTWAQFSPSSPPWLQFFLAVPDPPVAVAGDYSLTFIADAACTGLPIELRTRTYSANIAAQLAPGVPTDTMFTVRVGAADFLDGYSTFLLGVAGDHLTFSLEESEGPWLVERLSPTAYLGLGGIGAVSVGASTSTISTSFDGSFDYCVRRTAMGSYYSCAPEQAVERQRCQSASHRLIVTRR
jgi:hypothetical protein